MSLTIQNTTDVGAVNPPSQVTPLEKRMEREHGHAPAADTDPVVPDQGEDEACDQAESAQPEECSEPADGFIERIVTDPRTGEAMLALRLSPVSVPMVPAPPENAQPAAAQPGAAPPATEGDVPTTLKPGRTLNPALPSVGSPTLKPAVTSPLSPNAPAPGAALQSAAQPEGAAHVSPAKSDGVVGNGRGAALPTTAQASTAADASRDPEAPRAPTTETAGATGKQENNAAPQPPLMAQDAANRHSADAAAGNAGQARSEADTANQRNLQHVQQAQKTAEALAERVRGTRVDFSFTSWGQGNSVSLSRQPGGHWTAIPSNARVGQALGSDTPHDLQVRHEGETLRVEEGSMTDPDGRRRQQHEHDTP